MEFTFEDALFYTLNIDKESGSDIKELLLIFLSIFLLVDLVVKKFLENNV